jgi:anaerobic ribonucleoside-triphosphate reductase activating protein
MPEFILEPRPEYAVSVLDLCAQLDRAIAEHNIEGVSFSGGEPFAQAPVLAVIARHARSRGLSTLAWSGWTHAHLKGVEAPLGSREFLATLDVLIDGPYVREQGPPQPLRGSKNQRIRLLTRRYRQKDMKETAIEVSIANGRVVISGVTNYDALRAALAAVGVW